MRTRISLLAVHALALTILVAAPAHAEFYTVDDPADTKGSLTDIYRLEARHGDETMVVKVRFAELIRSSAAGVSVFFDTDRDRKGPEYVLSSGLGDGTDYVLTAADGWRASGDQVRCDYRARPKWGQEVFRAVVSRDCLDRSQSVRVSVKMVDQAGQRAVRDWAPKRRRWSLPLAPGLGV